MNDEHARKRASNKPKPGIRAKVQADVLEVVKQQGLDGNFGLIVTAYEGQAHERTIWRWIEQVRKDPNTLKRIAKAAKAKARRAGLTTAADQAGAVANGAAPPFGELIPADSIDPLLQLSRSNQMLDRIQARAVDAEGKIVNAKLALMVAEARGRNAANLHKIRSDALQHASLLGFYRELMGGIANYVHQHAPHILSGLLDLISKIRAKWGGIH